MRNLIYIIAIVLIGNVIQAQEMSWVPSKYIDNLGCEDQTSCAANMVCYKLQYKPAATGTMTSYTTGFIINCADGVSAVKVNTSCVMGDNSQQVVACEDYGKIMLNCSGNTGQLNVVKDEAIYLHQICVQLEPGKNHVMIDNSEIMKLTTSIDGIGNKPTTEFSEYRSYKVVNNQEFCENAVENLTLSAELGEDGVAHLTWEPAKESPNGYYTIFKSTKGEQFESMGEVRSLMVNQQIAPDFKYEQDVDLEDFGEHVFKIMYSKLDGNSSVSNAAHVFYKDVRFTLSLAPNPTANFIRLFITSPEENVTMNLLDMNGQLVMRQVLQTDMEEMIDLRKIASGMYSVSVLSGDEVLTEKLIVID